VSPKKAEKNRNIDKRRKDFENPNREERRFNSCLAIFEKSFSNAVSIKNIV